MTDPSMAAPAGAAMSGPDVLLATKLHVPRPRPGFVPRQRLAEALSEGLARGLVLVCAPAGFGKTALLAGWACGGGRPVAWLGLDAGDSDPARFWRYVVAALDRARPGLAGRVGPPPSRSFEGLVTALINELAADPGPDEVLLVLDDYHLVDSGPVHESVAFLLENLPPCLRVVVSGRADPPLPLARLRARGQLAELRAADLRFTPEEAAALLGETAGPGLPGTAVAALVARTEGWAAGLQLAGLSLRGHADVAGFAAAFSGSHRFVLDYLADEVLDGQPGPVRAFLLETSVLERLTGELCDAVTGRAGSQAMLAGIERAGLFLVPLDEVRGWWRYHPLFADLLRARLRAEQPGRVQALHRAAAAWCEEHDLAEDAVRHALAAGDPAWAARLVERYVEELLGRSEGVTLRRWPPTGRRWARPARAARQPSRAWRTWAWPRSCTSGTSWPPPLTTPPGGSRCAGSLPSPRRWPPAWLSWPGSGRRTVTRPGPGRRWDEAGQAGLSPQVITLLSPVPAQRAWLLLAQGDVHAAAQWTTAAGLSPDDEPDYPQEPAYLVLARVLLAQNDPRPALALLQRLLDAAASQGRAGSVIEIQALRALALAACGDHASALGALTDALTLARPQRYVRVLADEGAPMRALLTQLSAARPARQHAARRIDPGYLAALVRACGQAAAVPPPGRAAAAPPGLAEPLTDRELDVLRLIAAGKSNQRIAHDLVVALDTVKTHVTHILGKLGAANRTEAAARARQLGLIP